MNAYGFSGKRCGDPSHWPHWVPLTAESNASAPQPPSSAPSDKVTSSPSVDVHSREAWMTALLRYTTQWMAILPRGVSSGTDAALHSAEIATGACLNAADSARALPAVQPVAMLNAMLVSLPTAVAVLHVQRQQQRRASPPRPEEVAEPGSSLTSTNVPELTPIIEDSPTRPPPLVDVAARLLRYSKWLASGLSHAAGPAPRLPSAALISHAYQHGLLAACSADWVVQFRCTFQAGAETGSTSTEKVDTLDLTASLPWTLPPTVLVESSAGRHVLQPMLGYRGTLVFLLFHPLRVVRVWARDVLLRMLACTVPQQGAPSLSESSSDGGERVPATLLTFALQLLCTLKHMSVLPAQICFLGLRPHPSSAASKTSEPHGDAVKYVMQDRVHTVIDGMFHLLTLLTAWDTHFGKAVEALAMTSKETADSASATSMPALLGKCRATVLLLGGSLVLYGLHGLHQGIHRALLEAWRDEQHRQPLSSSVRVGLSRTSKAAMSQLLDPLNTLLSSNPRMPRVNAVTAISIRKALAKVLVHCLLDNASGLASSKEEEAWRRTRLEWLWMFAAALEPPTPRTAAPLLADPPEASAPCSSSHANTVASGQQGSGPGNGAVQNDLGPGTLVWVPGKCAGWLLRPLLKNAAQQFQWAKAMAVAKEKPSAGGTATATATGGIDNSIGVLDKAVYGVAILFDSLATALPLLMRSTYLHDTLAAHELQLLTLAIGGIVHTRSEHALRLHQLLFHADVHAFAAGAAAQGRGDAAPTGLVGVPTVCLQRVWLTLPTLITQVCKSGAVSPADRSGHAGSSISGSPLPLSEVVASLCSVLTVLAEEDAMPCPQWLFMSPGKVMSRAPPPFQWVVQRCVRTLADTLQEQQELVKRVWLRLSSAPTEAAYAAAVAAAASRALTRERPLLRLLFALRVAAAEDAEASKLAERLTAVFCVGVTSSVARTLSAEAAMWVWQRVVVTQSELRLHPPPPSAASSAAAAASVADAACTTWNMDDAVITSTARTQGRRWLALLCACSFNQMSDWEVQCGWWMAALVADVVTLDVEQRRALAEQVILALPTAPMLTLSDAATHVVNSTHPTVEEAVEGQCGAIHEGEHQWRAKATESAQHRHSVVQRLLIQVLRKAEQYPQASLSSVLLRISDALPPTVVSRNVRFQQQIQPLLMQLCSRSPTVQKCLTQNGPMWLRRCTEQATQTMNECLAEQERRFRQFELEEATLKREQVTTAQAAVAAELLRHANEAKRVGELGQQRAVTRSTAASEVSQSGGGGDLDSVPMRTSHNTVSHHNSSTVSTAHRNLRQQQLFPDRTLAHLTVKRERTTPAGGAEACSPTSAPPRSAGNGSSRTVELDVDSDKEDVIIATSRGQLLNSLARHASPCVVTPPSPAPAPVPLAKVPKTSASTTASTTPLAAPTRLQHKLQEINARNTHRVHHAEQLRQLQERLRLVPLSTNLLHLDAPLVHDIVGPGSQCMAPETPVLPEVFVPASDVLRGVFSGGAAASAGGASLKTPLTMPFGSVTSEYAMCFAPHIALELRYDIIRNYEDFLGCVWESPNESDSNSSHHYRHSAPRATETAGEGASPSPVNCLWSNLLPLHPGIPPACVAVQNSGAVSHGHNDEVIPGARTLHFDVRVCANPAVEEYLQRLQQQAQGTRSSAQRYSATSTTMPSTYADAVVLAAAQQGLSAALSEGDVVAVLLPLQTILVKWVERQLRRPLSECPTGEVEIRVQSMLDTLPHTWRTLGCAVQVCNVQSLSLGGRAAHLCATPSVVEQSTGGHGHPSLRFSHVFRMAYDTASSPTFYVRKLTSINASLMELEALHKIDHTRFAATVYDPRSTAPAGKAFYGWATSILSTGGPSRAVPLLDQLRVRLLQQQHLNDWQVRAIAGVLYAVCPGWDDGVAEQNTRAPVPCSPEALVIEGPPGTGKTQTIGTLTLNLLHHLSRAWGTSPRILVCAPSNCGVDEALLRVVRLREQLRKDAPGGGQRPARAVLAGGLVRIGVRERVDREVLRLQEPVFFDDVVERHLRDTPATAESLRRGERTADGNGAAIGRAAVRNSVRTHTLESAAVVFSTLGSLHHIARQVPGLAFDVVIVDEASQGTEPAVLQALVLAKGKSVFVGDSHQLQPTVLSQEASRCGLGRSLLVRLLACGHPSFLLRTQYRMHPDIAAFPNEYFYGSKLLTDPSVLERSRAPDGPAAASATIAQKLGRRPRFVFVDVRESPMERRRGRSLFNRREAAAVVHCMRQLRAFFKIAVREMAAHISIITFYSAQKDTILSALTHEERHSGVQVATVDSFQGKEKRIILLSCVRTLSEAQLQRLQLRVDLAGRERSSDDSDGAAREERIANRHLGRYGLGFLADGNRLNVALTRAQDLCVCFASRDTVRGVGMAAMASAVPPTAVTAVDSAAEEVEHRLGAGNEDPLALFRMLLHAETHDPIRQPRALDPVVLDVSGDSVEIVEAPSTSRSRAACLVHDSKADFLRELTARAEAVQGEAEVRNAQC